MSRLSELPMRRRTSSSTRGEEMRLADLPVGVEARVTRIDGADRGRLHRLASMGILPGARLRLLRAGSAFLASLDGCQVGFDAAVARAVWVAAVS